MLFFILQEIPKKNKLKTNPSPLALIGMEIIFISFSKRDKNIALDSRKFITKNAQAFRF
jgi:hypothetical protein